MKNWDLEIGRWNLGLKNFKDEKKCELELFRSRIFNNQFLKFVGLEDGPRRMAMQGGAFGYGPKVEYGSNQHSFSWALSTLAAIAQRTDQPCITCIEASHLKRASSPLLYSQHKM